MIVSAPKHPAKFSSEILQNLDLLVQDITLKNRYLGTGYDRILDPFGGIGGIKDVFPDAVTMELEPEWALQAGGVIGNALQMPYKDGSFDMAITSPVYGNRMSDHHNAKDGSRRITYRHTLGRPLHPDNAGQLQWGDRYRDFHTAAWMEVYRVLRKWGLFILNVSDHIRGGKVMQVSQWHFDTIISLGFRQFDYRSVPTKRMRFGQNGGARIDHENIFVFRKYQT